MDLKNTLWSDDQVASANGFQQSGVWHPFTCKCGKDLIATNSGWKCDCGYTQDWAHVFMLDGSWRNSPMYVLRAFSSHDVKISSDQHG